MRTTDDDDLPLGDPAESLALIERERANLERDITPDPRLMSWPWGFAWLVGFLVFFLRFGPDERVLVDMPSWLPLTVLLGLLLGAGVLSATVGIRLGRHVTGPSARQGMLYGFTWSIAFAGLSVLFSQFSGLLAEPQQNLLWAGGMCALTGALHMAGGAVYDDRHMFILGAWISATNVIGIVVGPGWHALIVAVAGGGGMIVAGLIGWLRLR